MLSCSLRGLWCGCSVQPLQQPGNYRYWLLIPSIIELCWIRKPLIYLHGFNSCFEFCRSDPFPDCWLWLSEHLSHSCGGWEGELSQLSENQYGRGTIRCIHAKTAAVEVSRSHGGYHLEQGRGQIASLSSFGKKTLTCSVKSSDFIKGQKCYLLWVYHYNPFSC